MSEIKGISTREVWDFRLSTASVRIMRDKTWKVELWSKKLPVYKEGQKPNEPLSVYDTGIPVVKGDHHDRAKLKVCFEWLKAVRDDYALPDIEELKPAVAEINRINSEIAEAQAGLTPEEARQTWLFIRKVKAVADKRGLTMDETLQLMVDGINDQMQEK